MHKTVKSLVFIAFFLVAILVVGLFFNSSSSAALNWAQTNTDGFGSAANVTPVSMVTYDGYLYAPIGNTTVGFKLFRSLNGSTWEQIGSDGFGDINNVEGIMSLAYGNLYIYTQNDTTGGEIWKSTDGSTLAQICFDGAGDANNTIFVGAAVFESNLYLGTYNTTTGAEIIRVESNDTCTQVNTDGFGGNNTANWSMLSANGYLYAGAYNTTTGAEVWRSDDGTTWTQVSSLGFGDANNEDVRTMFFHNGYVYAGTFNNTTGAEIWRSSDGTTWNQTNTDGFGDANNVWPGDTTAVVNNIIYVGVRDDINGAALFSSPDGSTWTQEGTDGFGDANNFALYAQTFDGRIYLGFSNDITGAEIWRSDTIAQLLLNDITLPTGSVGSAYNYPLSVTNGTPSYLYSLSGDLPPGLTMSVGGVISGTPTTSGTYTFTATVSDTGFPIQTASRSFSITIPANVLPETGAGPSL